MSVCAGTHFGYQPGGWGKPPVDEEGNPVYGDVFGTNAGDAESDDEVRVGARTHVLKPCVICELCVWRCVWHERW
jgi:hypothetical protein